MNRGAAGWLTLAVLSQAAAHQLVKAGKAVGYQHYPGIGEILRGDSSIFLLVIALQGLAVSAGLFFLYRQSGSTPGARWRLVALVAASSLLSATFSQDPGVYAAELLLASAIQLVALGNVVLVVMSIPDAAAAEYGERFTRLLSAGSPEPRYALDRFSLAAALWVGVIAAVLAVISYGRHPHVPDEVVYLINADYFAQWKLFLTPPPVAAPFDVDLMMMTADKWFVPVPPLWPAVLAIGVAVGAPWMVNPVLAFACTLLAYLLLLELYPRRTARLSLLLLCVSPWFLFMGMNFMTHMLALGLALSAALAVARLVRTRHLGWAIVGGAAIGGLTLVRPLEAVIVALLLGVWTLTTRRILAVGSLVASCGAVASLNFLYNSAITGSPLTFPMSAYIAKHYISGANDLGFGANRGLGWPGLDPFPGHGLIDVVVNTGLNSFAVNVELFGWATGSLVFLFALFAFGRLNRSDWMLLAAAVSVVAIHSVYWFSGGPDFGARYWFLIIVPCVALTARGVESLAASGMSDAWSTPRAGRAVAAVTAMCIAALITFVPWRASDKYHNYRRMRPDIPALARENDFGNALVLIHGNRHPDFASAVIYSSLFTGKGPVYAWGRDAHAEAEARAAFPDRAVRVVDGPTITGRGFELAASDTTRSSR